MIDQSFSYENLREIYDIEKRKGYSLDGMFNSSEKIDVINTQIKDIYKDIKTIKGKFKTKNKISDARKKKLNLDKDKLEEKLKNIKESKNNLLKKEIEKISDQINSKFFRIKINKKENFLENKKPFYSIQEDIGGLLFIKHIQRQLNRLFKIKQSNRYLIVSQICEILKNNDTTLFNIIKIDIKDFYESINLTILEDQIINNNNLISPQIKKHIIDILNQYKELSRCMNGIPRGIGFSAYLGELYLRSFDKEMKEKNEIFYYARYVDDIIIITAKNSLLEASSITFILNNLGLKLNDKKYFNLRDPLSTKNSFEYLGYNFTYQCIFAL